MLLLCLVVCIFMLYIYISLIKCGCNTETKKYKQISVLQRATCLHENCKLKVEIISCFGFVYIYLICASATIQQNNYYKIIELTSRLVQMCLPGVRANHYLLNAEFGIYLNKNNNNNKKSEQVALVIYRKVCPSEIEIVAHIRSSSSSSIFVSFLCVCPYIYAHVLLIVLLSIISLSNSLSSFLE